MDVSRANESTFRKGDEGRFTGEVWLRSTVRSEDGTDIALVHFAPSARTRWHRHWGEHVTDEEYAETFPAPRGTHP